ncbi:MAG TPA: hypothetical protein VNM24_11925 [Burkholderiales bacterium]|nr:hypothetical protein [Burkholderiales bacterium]
MATHPAVSAASNQAGAAAQRGRRVFARCPAGDKNCQWLPRLSGCLSNPLPKDPMRDYAMFWVLLEVVLGLALFVFIIWWTLPKKDDRDDRKN